MPELLHSIDLVSDRCCRGDEFEEKLQEFDRVQRTIIEASCSPDDSRLMKRHCGLNLELERLKTLADRLCEVEIFNSSDDYNLCADAERFDHLNCYYVSINSPLAIPVGVLGTLASVGVHRERLEEVKRELDSDTNSLSF